MFRKFILVMLSLPLIPLAVADEDGPNPGDDNPGTTEILMDFAIGGRMENADMCFSSVDWCAEQISIARELENTKVRGKNKEANANAVAWAEVACRAASRAGSYWEAWFEGGGELSLKRHGNYGAMHHIRLDAGLDSGTFTVARAGSLARAWVGTSAYAFAGARGWDEVCGMIDIDEETLEWCAYAAAAGLGESEAEAQAGSLSTSQAAAESSAIAGVTLFNEVWAANIERYEAAATTLAGSFSAVEAEAFAAAFAEAFASAYARAFALTCANAEYGDRYREICSQGEAEAAAYAYAFALAYAEAQASAFAWVRVQTMLPVLYVNENGIEDTIVFGPDATTVSGRAALGVTCVVPEDPEN